MSDASDYLENKLLDHSLGTSAFTMPTNVYVALFSNDPGDDNSGTELTAQPGYARQLTTFNAASGGSATNSSAETFTSSSGDWVTATHFGVMDALTAGNQLFHGELSSGIVIGTSGHTFAAGDFTVSAD